MRILLIIACLAALGFPTVARAENDLEIGSYRGNWCNYEAVFSIDRKVPGKWVFHGTLIIPSTNESDRLWIEQYDDNSLLMIRSLSGGLVQRSFMAPPVPRNGRMAFFSSKVDGPGCPPGAGTFFFF